MSLEREHSHRFIFPNSANNHCFFVHKTELRFLPQGNKIEEKGMKDKGQIENQTTSDFASGGNPPPPPPFSTSNFGEQAHAVTSLGCVVFPSDFSVKKT